MSQLLDPSLMRQMWWRFALVSRSLRYPTWYIYGVLLSFLFSLLGSSCNFLRFARFCYKYSKQGSQRIMVHSISHLSCVQWRSKALRGPGSTATWGPSLSLPSTPPSLPFPPLPPPSPSPLPRSGPQIELGRLGDHCKHPPAGSGGNNFNSLA